jgi:hypothetical protein
MSFLLCMAAAAGRLTLPRARFVHLCDAPSVIRVTLVYLATSPFRSLKLRQLDRLTTRPTDAAVQRVLDDERAQRLVLTASKDVDDEWLRLRMLAARPTTAEATCAKRRPLANPAIHNPSLSPCRRSQSCPDIMRRPGPEFAWFFTGGAHQPKEVLAGQAGQDQVRCGRDRGRPGPTEQQR